MTVEHRASASSLQQRLKKELRAAGLKTEALDTLPEWWQEAIELPAGMYEIRGFVAKHFGLEIGPDGTLRQRLMPPACFKTRGDTSITDVASARGMATAVARIVAAATIAPVWSESAIFNDAGRLRAHILGLDDPWVGLEQLLSQCWLHGVPVIYMPSLPVTNPKMDGMVTVCGNRPVIILASKTLNRPAWMLFVLAHEMGHLALGHVGHRDGESIVDEKVEEAGTELDQQEEEANQYALELLTGKKKRISLSRLVRARKLATEAEAYGRIHHIDPGHLILNAARNAVGQNIWPLANKAIAQIREDDSATICRRFMQRYLDMDSLSDDSLTFLERLSIL